MSSNSLDGRSYYDEDTDLQPWIIATTVAITLLALLTVALRFFARYIRAAPLGADDYLILSSMVSKQARKRGIEKSRMAEIGVSILAFGSLMTAITYQICFLGTSFCCLRICHGQ